MGHRVVFGRNDAIDTSSSVVRTIGGSPIFPTTEDFVSLESDSVNDTLAGTGARVVKIDGLDQNYKRVTEMVYMDGITPVSSKKKYIRVNEILVLSSGDTESNEGTILCKRGVTDIISIRPEASISISSLYTLDEYTTAKLDKVFANTEKGKDVEVILCYRVSGTKYIRGVVDLYENQGEISIDKKGQTIPAKSDLWIEAKSSAPLTTCSCFYIIETIKDLKE